MTDELFPCDHCGGNFKIGWSQRVKARIGESEFDYSQFGRETEGPPIIGDTCRRPLSAPQTERLVCIYCQNEDCGMQTPWEPIGDDEHAAMAKVGAVWNRRTRRPTCLDGDLLDLIRKELSAVDAPFILDLLARNSEKWEERGPQLAMAAQKIVDSKITMRDFWAIDPVLKDASRYRKLVQLVKVLYIDQITHLQFPRVVAVGSMEHHAFEDRIAASVDELPDRNRW